MKSWFAVVLALLVSACSSVPPEVVALSTQTGTDTRALHEGYRAVVRKHFETLRKVREQEFADKVLAPYINDAISQGRLLDVIAGKVVYDSATDSFVPPDPAKATVQKLDTLATWNRQVASDIEGLRKSAFGDLEQQESQVLNAVDAAFGNIQRGNDAILGYLLSLQKVDAAQNDLFRRIGLDGFPKKVGDALQKASDDAAAYTQRVDKLNTQAQDTKGRIKALQDQVRKMQDQLKKGGS